jgi:hypothetical protein
VNNTEKKFLEFDLDEVRDLKFCYEQTIESLLADLPGINWNSRLEVKDYFKYEHGIKIDSLQIGYLEARLSLYKANCGTTPASEIMASLIEYLKLKYTIKNYLDCILNHADENGKVPLRVVEGCYVMPNRQPLPEAQAILDCLSEKGEE